MRKNLFWAWPIFLGLAFLSAGPAAAAPLDVFKDRQGTIDIAGGTAHIPVMTGAARRIMEINPKIVITVAGGGSGVGVQQVGEGLARIGNTGRPLKKEEIEKYGLVSFPFAIDGVAVVVHPDNPVRELSLEQLRGIYTGKIVNWKEVGGRDEKIVVISRDSSSGTFETWAEMIMKGDRVAPAALMQASNGGVAQTVANNRRAIGYIGFGYLNPSLKKIKVEGMEATAQNALSKAWPIARELYIFTNGEPAGAVKRLVDYLLDARKGQKAVAETGFIPLPAKTN